MSPFYGAQLGNGKEMANAIAYLSTDTTAAAVMDATHAPCSRLSSRVVTLSNAGSRSSIALRDCN
jgi:hypothetical protein